MAASDLAKPEKLAYLEDRIPLGRVTEPEDMAGPAVFLVSDVSRYCVSEWIRDPSGSMLTTVCRQDRSFCVMVDCMYICNKDNTLIARFENLYTYLRKYGNLPSQRHYSTGLTLLCLHHSIHSIGARYI